MPDAAIGLCADCQHCRIVRSERSTFYLCQRSLTDPAFRKYPPLPVLACRGYDATPPAGPVTATDDKLTG
jgi:hypothetical protein